jgi:D-inositol-3-phosphate glycosyltransferase
MSEIRRVAMVSVHTSPLEQPGTGDAGGMNVYVAEVAKELAARGVEVDIFTRATTGTIPPVAELVPGVSVRHITAGPYEGLSKQDLPGQLCAFAAGVMRAAAARPEGWYDVLHSHYWLSGQVGWLAADRWGVPLVHTMHTMARVKNLHLPSDDTPEPPGREIGEAQVVEAADRLVANTEGEAADLVELYDADPAKVRVVTPGVDLATFTPGPPPAPPSACPRTPGCSSSSEGSNRSSVRTCCCAWAQSCSHATPTGGTTSSSPSSAVPAVRDSPTRESSRRWPSCWASTPSPGSSRR